MSDPAKLQRSPALNFALKKSVLRNERHSRLLDYLIGVPYLWSQCSKKGGTKELSECVCVLKWERRREGGCEREITQAEGRVKTVETERRKWAVKTVLSYRSSVCLEESEVALGLLLLPLASGEAAPGSPGGTEAIVWDTVLAATLWPSNKPNTTRVSPRPDAQHLTAVMNIPLTSFNWGTNLAARGYHVGWSIQKQVSSKQRETKRQQAQTGVEVCMQMECGDCEMCKQHKTLSVCTHLRVEPYLKTEIWGYKAPADSSSLHVLTQTTWLLEPSYNSQVYRKP